MRTTLALGAALGALALAGTAAAAGSGASVQNESSCTTTPFATVCTTVKTTTSSTETPSGNVSYSTNGTVERRMSFVFGGTYVSTEAVHVHVLQKQGEDHVRSERLSETTEYRSGTYALTCVSGFAFHYANGAVQAGDYTLDCTVG